MFDVVNQGVDGSGVPAAGSELGLAEPLNGAVRKAGEGAGEVSSAVAGLSSVPAGAELAAALAAIDPGLVDGYGRVVLWEANQRQVAHYQACGYGDMVAVQDVFLEATGGEVMGAFEGASGEFETAGALTRRGAQRELTFAESIWRRLPQVGQALYLGLIDYRRARRFVDGTAHLDVEMARGIVDDLIEVAAELTPSQLTGRIRRRCIDQDPDDAKTRNEKALEGRAAMTLDNPDGTASFMIHSAPAVEVLAASRHVDYLARGLKQRGDGRSMDQLRSDVALDLLQGHPTGRKANVLGGVMIHVSLDTLTGLAEEPADLAGYGDVIADVARQTVLQQQDAPWEFTVVDDHGDVVACGTTLRRPTTAQARHVRARYHCCVFPGCRMPSEVCDLDHRNEYSKTGRTCSDDLYPHCRYHHRIRHEHNWQYRRLVDGTIQYTTALGHTRISQPRGDPLTPM